MPTQCEAEKLRQIASRNCCSDKLKRQLLGAKTRGKTERKRENGISKRYSTPTVFVNQRLCRGIENAGEEMHNQTPILLPGKTRNGSGQRLTGSKFVSLFLDPVSLVTENKT